MNEILSKLKHWNQIYNDLSQKFQAGIYNTPGRLKMYRKYRQVAFDRMLELKQEMQSGER